MKLRLLLDLDDVLNELMKTWLAEYNSRYGTDIRESDITSWSIDSLGIPGLEPDRFYNMLDEQGLYMKSEPREGSREAIAELAEYFDMHIVSSCTPAGYVAKRKWAAMHYPEIPESNFIACHNKHMVQGDILVDDNPDNLRNFVGLKIVMARTMNHPDNYDYDFNYIRVDNWSNLKRTLLMIAAEMQNTAQLA